jgi:deoxyribodipyrimidine photo-lyase
MEKTLVWFRNDLRTHDHEALYKAAQQNPHVVPVYVYDPRQFKMLDLGFRKTGVFRAKFLIESVDDLQKSLQKIGSNLIIRIGKPEEIIPQLAHNLGVSAVYTSEEVTYEETQIDRKVEEQLNTLGLKMSFFWMATLFHYDDLPIDNIQKLPDVFTEFRKKSERFAKVRNSFGVPALKSFPELEANIRPNVTLEDLGFDHTEAPTHDSRAVLPFVGGETEALKRLTDYFWNKDLLKNYKETRNEMLGADYSSKFSVWLANGCLSPRRIYEEVKRYEHQRTSNDSTYWLVFELIWRDYFRFVSLKFGNSLFFASGIKNDQRIDWKHHQPTFERWVNGQTGIPLIDANMQELLLTGFMSNRGRQNVASFLTKDLLIDWTWGAAWFESQLIDYDVCSNYGNWNYVAGVGNDPRENRYFNIYTQATRYDQHGHYVKHWLPQLAKIPAPRVHATPAWTPKEQTEFGVRLGVDFPNAIINTQKWLR